MQASIFDIFGSEIHNQQNLQQSASSHVIEGHVSENIKVKSINDGPSKKALADIGNKDKKNKALLDKTKLLAPSNDEENASSNLLTRTPVHKSKIYMQTPNMKPLVRSPLSDLLPKPKLSVSTLQQSIEIVPAEDLELEEIENLINGYIDDFVGDLDEYIYEDEFTDILPKSVLHTDEEIYRLRHFWKVLKVPFDSPSYEDLAVDVAVENDLGYLFNSPSSFDEVLEEPFPVPVFTDI